MTGCEIQVETVSLFLQKCHKTVGKVFGCMYRHHCYCLQSTNPQVSSANTPRWGWGGKGGAFWWIFCGCGEQMSFLGTTQLTIHSWRIAADDTKTGFRSLDRDFFGHWGKYSNKYSEALEYLLNTSETFTCPKSNYSRTLEYLVLQGWNMSFVQISRGTWIFGIVYCPKILGHLFRGFILDPGRHLQLVHLCYYII